VIHTITYSESNAKTVNYQEDKMIVSRGTLIRMKRLAGRTQDLADLEKLEGGDEA
jgi:hypothetical protein